MGSANIDVKHPGTDPDVPDGARSLSTLGFIVVVAVYLAILKVTSWLANQGVQDQEYATFGKVEVVLRQLILPVGVSAVFVVAVVTWLGWWPNVMRDHRPARRWVWTFPAIMVAAILAGTAYPELIDRSAGFVLLLLTGALLVGFTEELLFRGVGVTAFRSNAFPETRVALWTAVIFGLMHATNIFLEGPSALAQVFSTAVAGFFFYLVLRVSGSLAAAMILHGLWDFGLFSGNIAEAAYLGTTLFVLANIVMVVVALIGARRIGLAWPPKAARAT